MNLPIPHGPDHSSLEVNAAERDSSAGPEAVSRELPEVTNAEEWSQQSVSVPSKAPRRATVCGLRRRTFWIIVCISLFLIAVAAAVEGALSTRSTRKNDGQNTSSDDSAGASKTNSTSSQHTPSPLLNTSGLAAVQWKDGATHYRVYFQSKSGIIQESAWDSDGPDEWKVSNVTDIDTDTTLGTPIAAAAGWPMAEKSNDPVKKILWLGQTSLVYQLEAPANGSGEWAPTIDVNGDATSTNNSRLAVRWDENLDASLGTLSFLYQLNSSSADLSIWSTDNDGITHDDDVPGLSLGMATGSGLALGLTGADKTVIVYTMDDNGFINGLNYNYTDSSTSKTTDFDVKLQFDTPYTIVAQDNRHLENLTDECVNQPLTQLLLYASADRSTLQLVSSNCTYPISDIQNSKLLPLLKPGRSYLALASHDDGRVYVMFDENGAGPQIEEWTVPATVNDGPWKVARSVTVGNS